MVYKQVEELCYFAILLNELNFTFMDGKWQKYKMSKYLLVGTKLEKFVYKYVKALIAFWLNSNKHMCECRLK